jgi:O-antigen/teichoic acid export membrane protein
MSHPPSVADLAIGPSAAFEVELSTRMATNTAVQFVAPAVRMLLGIAMAAALSRYLGPKGLGEYALVFAYVAIFNGIFNDFGLGSTCLREISRTPKLRAAILSSAAALQLVVSGVTYVLLLLGLVVAHYPAPVTEAAALYGLTLFGTSIDLLALVFSADLQLKRLLGPALVGSLVMFGLTLAGVALHASLLTLVLAAMTGVVAQYVWSIRRAFKALELVERPSPALWPSLIRQSLPLGLNSVASAIAQQAPLLVLSVLSLSAVGLFNAAGKIPLQLLIVPAAIRTTTFPLLSAAWVSDRERFHRLLHHAIVLSLFAAGPIAVAGVGLASVLMPLLFGAGFEASGAPFQYLLLVSVVLFPAILVGEALIATEHQRANLLLSVATLPVLVVLLAAWTPGGGAVGAAAALLGYYGIQFAAAVVIAERLLHGRLVEPRLLLSATLIVVCVGLAFLVDRDQPYVAVPLASLTFAVLMLFHRDTLSRLTDALMPRLADHLRGGASRPGS